MPGDDEGGPTGIVAGLLLFLSTVIALGAVISARGAHIRAAELTDSLTEREFTATTDTPFSHLSQGGHPGGRDRIMAVIADDLRAGVVDVFRSEKRTIVAYVTGALLIAAGALFDDSLHLRGGPITVVGGTIIALAIFVPFVTAKVTERLRPDLDQALAEVYSTMHDALATAQEEHALDLREVRQAVGEIRAQL